MNPAPIPTSAASEEPLVEHRARLEREARDRGQPASLAGWRELLGPMPPAEEGEEPIEVFEGALREVRKGYPKVPVL